MTRFPFKITRNLGITKGRPSFLKRPNFDDALVEIEIYEKSKNKTNITQPYVNLLSNYFLFLVGLIDSKAGQLNRFEYDDYDLGFNVEVTGNDFVITTFDGILITKIPCWEALQETFKELNKQINIALSEGRLNKEDVLPLMYNMPFYLSI